MAAQKKETRLKNANELNGAVSRIYHYACGVCNAKTEDEVKEFAKENAIKESVKSGMISPEQLPRELKEILAEAPIKKVIGPIQTPDSDLFFMKCKITNKKVIPSDDELRMRLETEKMEQLSERLLKNAKRFSVVEMKI